MSVSKYHVVAVPTGAIDYKFNVQEYAKADMVFAYGFSDLKVAGDICRAIEAAYEAGRKEASASVEGQLDKERDLARQAHDALKAAGVDLTFETIANRDAPDQTETRAVVIVRPDRWARFERLEVVAGRMERAEDALTKAGFTHKGGPFDWDPPVGDGVTTRIRSTLSDNDRRALDARTKAEADHHPRNLVRATLSSPPSTPVPTG